MPARTHGPKDTRIYEWQDTSKQVHINIRI